MCNDSGTDCDVRNPAKKDAEIVRLARAAGAIPIAVTNTPQLCMNWETYNNVTGLTLNPYNLKHTAGGSSGGEVSYFDGIDKEIQKCMKHFSHNLTSTNLSYHTSY